MCKIDTTSNGAPPKLRKVTIMTAGSRGDVQPFVAIGIALKKAGYSVRVMTNPSETHATLLNDFGLEHVPVGPDADKLLREDVQCRKAMETGNSLEFFKLVSEIVENDREIICQPFYDEMLAHDGENRPDLFIVSFLCRYFGVYTKHVLKIPTMEIDLQFFAFDIPTRAPMGFPTLPFGMHKFILTQVIIPQDYKKFNKFDKCLAEIIAFSSTKEKAISATSTSSSSTSSITTTTTRLEDFLLYDQLVESEINHSPLLPMIICQSPFFRDILHPSIRNKNIKFVGPAIIEKSDQTRGDTQSFGNESRNRIEAFIASDIARKPIYMGWGSMIHKSKEEMAIFAVDALMMSNQRGIILGGSAGLNMEALEHAIACRKVTSDDYGKKLMEYAKVNVIFVEKASHEWLFPKVSMTVHHGGAGTTNVALRAGVPTIVTPVFLDQFDNAFVVQRLGVGIGFEEQLQKINADILSKAIHTVLNDPAMAQRAKEIGDRVRKERGCEEILKQIEKYWADEVVTKKFDKDVEDWEAATKELKSRNERTILRSRVLIGSSLVMACIAYLLNM